MIVRDEREDRRMGIYLILKDGGYCHRNALVLRCLLLLLFVCVFVAFNRIQIDKKQIVMIHSSLNI